MQQSSFVDTVYIINLGTLLISNIFLSSFEYVSLLALSNKSVVHSQFLFYMLNFIILAVFAYLTFRVVNRAFLNLEALVSSLISKPSEDIKPQPPPPAPVKSAIKKQASPPKVEKPAPSKPSQKKVSVPSKVQEASQPVRDIFGNIKVERKSQVMTPLEGGTKRNSYQQFQKELKLEAKASQERAELQELQRELQIYKAEHEQMLQQIQKYKQEKQSYVNRIEDIIQHVISSQPAPQIIPELENDAQMKALAELTKGIDQVHQTETERFQKRELEFKSEMSNFEQRIKQQYDDEINTLRLKLREKEEYIELLRRTPRERVVQEGNNSSLQKEIAVYIQKLKEKDVEIEKMKSSLQNRQSPVKSSPAKTTESNVLLEENQQLKIEKQSLLTQLQASNLELEVLRAKFRQQKDKSSIFENDKLEEEIKLKAQVESLEKLKLDLQLQVEQLSEALFKEQQDKSQKIAEAKEQLSRKHELEMESLTKQLEKEQQDRKQAQRKVAETQSELQFVQEQLKTAGQSEKALNAQIQALKSPKKPEKSTISISDVQSHTEYLRLKQKVDQLETTIKQNKTSDKALKSEESIQPERKVNYARTKIERQASPTFQYETKERTPVKVEPKIVSSIFTGPVDRVEKMKSPISLRYNTPAERPVVQSSIFQGGLMSEVYFGETNILNPNQREFVISQINFLKKISAKRTKLLYRSHSANFEKAVIEYCGNVPNILIVVELSNTRVFAAFTQAAFNKESSNSQEKKYTSANKAMIMDLNRMEVIINAASQETIRYEQGSLIWGRNEFVVFNEGILACQLNCNDAIYPCKYSSQEFLGTANKSATFSKYEIYRIFLG